MNISSIDWKIVYARVSATTLAFAVGGTLSHVIPGRPGLIVTAAAGTINALLPRIQKDAGILTAIKAYLASSKAAKAQKRTAVLKVAVDELLKTGAYIFTKDGLKPASEVALGSEVAAEDTVAKEEAVAKEDILAPVKADEDPAAALITEARDIAAV